MVQIFADLSAMQGDILRIGGSDYNHIKNVLRMKPGDELSVRSLDGTVPPAEAMAGTDRKVGAGSPPGSGLDPGKESLDGAGGIPDSDGPEEAGADDEYRFGIEAFTETEVVCRLRFIRHSRVELPVRVLLFQGLPKADKMDLIVQKAVEMGAAEIIPVEMHRSVVKLAGSKRQKRVARWQSIAEAAAKQSRRALLPQVHEILSMEEAVRYAAQAADVLFVPYERMADEPETGTRALLDALRPGQTAAVFVGPEGGFEDREVAAVIGAGGHTLSLGRRILRTETAALAFLAFLIYRFEL